MGRTVGLLAGAGAVAAVGLLAAFGLLREDAAPEVAAILPSDGATTSLPLEASSDAVSSTPARALDDDTSSGAEPTPSATAPQVASKGPAAMVEPRIDTLRIEPDGMALFSGLTDPNATVEIVLGDAIVASGSSGTDGSFLIFGDVPRSAQAGALELRSTGANGTTRRGEQTFIVEPPRPRTDRLPIDLADAETGRVAPSLRATQSAGPSDAFDPGALPQIVEQASDALVDDSNTQTKRSTVTVDQTGAQSSKPKMLANETAGESSTFADPDTLQGPLDRRSAQTEVALATDRLPPDLDTSMPRQEPATLPLPDTAAAPANLTAAQTGDAGVNSTAVASSSPAVSETDATPPPRVLRVDGAGLSVVQGGPTAALSIDTISYDSDGSTVLGGRAPSNAGVRVYVDNSPVDVSRSGPEGQWRLDLPRLEEQVYTLRVDQIDADGSVVARAETPFKPEDAETLDALAATEEDGVRRITVQPGFTLWAIAERNYGNGVDYVKVFEANAADIRNPDLIYPGQIFDVPDSVSENIAQ